MAHSSIRERRRLDSRSPLRVHAFDKTDTEETDSLSLRASARIAGCAVDTTRCVGGSRLAILDKTPSAKPDGIVGGPAFDLDKMLSAKQERDYVIASRQVKNPNDRSHD